MSRSKEEFFSIKDGSVGMYTCGPTIYNFAHIGNFRAYMFEDLLRRVLKYAGYDVTQIMNLTDVDDKTIRDSRAAGIPLDEFTKKYKKAFFEDMGTLRIEKAERYPEATRHVGEMIALIKTLIQKGFAYQGEDGSVYFSIAKFADYGKLAKIDMENQRVGDRVSDDEYAKDSVADFALWKAWDEKDGDVVWGSPWGKGRPGWHIECSAMSMKYLGKTFDIHTGGIDNMFPHHEDEIAQSEAANGCKFVNYWLHCGYLIVNGEKMSKSLGNFFTLRDLLDKGWSAREMRYVLLSTHYRKRLNFSEDALTAARDTLRSFSDLFRRLGEVVSESVESDDQSVGDAIQATKDEFESTISDDLNAAGAIAAAHKLSRTLNKAIDSKVLSASFAESALDLYRCFDAIFAFFDVDDALVAEIPAEIAALVEERVDARKSRDFAKSDELRDALREKGWIVEDTPKGPVVKPIW
jgi:cysteinyl-tRNA synthetase